MYKGLTILLQRGMTKVIVETDATQVLLEDGSSGDCPSQGLIEDARIILRGCEYTIQHVLREGNSRADVMAKLGAEQPVELLVVNDPPAEVRNLLVVDMLGLSRKRV
ncbi:hypothetical protein ACSBR1_006300 [Camellia fascicularis]